MVSARHDQPVLAAGRFVLGIDVGKYKHAATILSPHGEILGSLQHFENTRAGIDRLETELCRPHGTPRRILVAMEATGHYWMPLYYELMRRGYSCIVINPIQTNAKLRCRIRKTKTDKLDSLGIARFVLTGEARAARQARAAHRTGAQGPRGRGHLPRRVRRLRTNLDQARRLHRLSKRPRPAVPAHPPGAQRLPLDRRRSARA
jgi:transposase